MHNTREKDNIMMGLDERKPFHSIMEQYCHKNMTLWVKLNLPIKGNFDRNFNRMKKITKNIFHKQFACKMASLKSSTLIGVHTCKSNGLIEKKPV